MNKGPLEPTWVGRRNNCLDWPSNEPRERKQRVYAKLLDDKTLEIRISTYGDPDKPKRPLETVEFIWERGRELVIPTRFETAFRLFVETFGSPWVK